MLCTTEQEKVHALMVADAPCLCAFRTDCFGLVKGSSGICRLPPISPGVKDVTSGVALVASSVDVVKTCRYFIEMVLDHLWQFLVGLFQIDNN